VTSDVRIVQYDDKKCCTRARYIFQSLRNRMVKTIFENFKFLPFEDFFMRFSMILRISKNSFHHSICETPENISCPESFRYKKFQKFRKNYDPFKIVQIVSYCNDSVNTLAINSKSISKKACAEGLKSLISIIPQ